jgi:hypothetical protein
MRGFQNYQQQMPQQGGSMVNPQTLQLLMQAYKNYQGQPGSSPGATGTSYAGSGDQGAGYGIGSPLVAGGASGQPDMSQPQSGIGGQQAQNPLLAAMMRQNQGQY